jgi:hypothetical protein
MFIKKIAGDFHAASASIGPIGDSISPPQNFGAGPRKLKNIVPQQEKT